MVDDKSSKERHHLMDRMKAYVAGILTAASLLIMVVSSPLLANPVTIEVWSIFPEHTSPGQELIAIARSFEELHPNIKVNVTVPSAIANNLKLSVISGNPPDVTFANGGIVGNKLTFASMFEPLSPLMERDQVADAYLPGALRSYGTWEGVTYAVPYLVDPNFAVLINRDVFRERGLDPDFAPTTPDDLIEVNRFLTRRNAQGDLTHVGMVPWRMYGEHTALLNWSLAFGESQLSDGRRYTLDDPNVTAALEWLVEYSEMFDGVEIDAFAAGYSMFDLNQIAIQPLTSGDATRAVETFPDIDYGLTWLPARQGGPAPAWLGGQWLAIPRGAKHQKEAWEFIKYATLDPRAIRLSIASRFAGSKDAYLSGAYDVTEYDRVMSPDVARLFSFYASLALDAQPILEAPIWYVVEMIEQIRKIVVTREAPVSEILAFNELLNSRMEAELRELE